MKSFFKKLAFVMALAMVVSTAAPAAASAAVEGWENFYIALENKSGEVPVGFTMTEGEEVDFRMVGAPSNWRNYARQWALVNPSTGEKVEKTEGWVKSTGLVKTKVAGLYELQYLVEGEVVGSVAITCVAEKDEPAVEPTTPAVEPTTPAVEPTTPAVEPTTPAVEPTTPAVEPTTPAVEPTTPAVDMTKFEFVQLTEKSGKLVFEGPVAYTAADVQLYRVFQLMNGGEFLLETDIDGFKLVEDKTAIEFAIPDKKFVNGDVFRVVVGDLEPVDIEPVIGTVNELQIVVSKSDLAVDEETSVIGTAEFAYKVLADGVELTNLYKDAIDQAGAIQYEIVSPTENEELRQYVDITGNVFSVTKAGVTAKVKATYTYDITLADGSIMQVTKSSEEVEVKSFQKQPWKFEGVADWGIVNTTDSKAKVKWYSNGANVQELAADVSYNGEYQIVLKLKADGKYYTTHAAGVENNKVELLTDSNLIKTNGYGFKFYSADTDLMLVEAAGENAGKIAVYKETPEVKFYVKLFQTVDGVEKELGYAIAGGIKVTAPRTLDEIFVVDGDKKVVSVELYSAALPGYEYLTTKELDVKSEDQYNNPWHDEAANQYTVTCTNVALNTLITGQNGLDGRYGVYIDNEGNIALDGSLIFANSNKSTAMQFTVKEIASKETYAFRVTIKKPIYEANTSVIKVDKIAGVDLNTYEKVTPSVADVDVNVTDKNINRAAVLTLYKTSGFGVNVGKYDNVALTGETISDTVEIVTTTGWKVPEDAAEGTRYVVVTGPNGAVYQNVTWDDENDDIKIAVTGTDGNGKMWYADKGMYTVKVITVRYKKAAATQNNYTVSTTFNVSAHASENVTLLERTTGSVKVTDETTLAQIVKAAFKFKRNGSEWKDFAATMIAENGVDAVVYGDYVIIKSVTINVPTDGKESLGWNQVKVDVNLSVQLVQE